MKTEHHTLPHTTVDPMLADLAAWFARDPSIEFRIAEAEWQAVDVHGYGLLFHHGHAVRYGGGVGGLVPVDTAGDGVVAGWRGGGVVSAPGR